MAGAADGFEYVVHGDEVRVSHRGKPATILRGPSATRFLADVATGDPQAVMARATGNYKRGNERVARNHPRNHPRTSGR